MRRWLEFGWRCGALLGRRWGAERLKVSRRTFAEWMQPLIHAALFDIACVLLNLEPAGALEKGGGLVDSEIRRVRLRIGMLGCQVIRATHGPVLSVEQNLAPSIPEKRAYSMTCVTV
jgi:hypothetical protein